MPELELPPPVQVMCPNCGTPCELVHPREIYGPDHWRITSYLYLCRGCGRYVGCHPGTAQPLGTPTDEEGRRARRLAHAAFDLLFKDGWMSRTTAYIWLADKLGIEVEECHIGMFDRERCEQVMQLAMAEVRSYRATARRDAPASTEAASGK